MEFWTPTHTQVVVVGVRFFGGSSSLSFSSSLSLNAKNCAHPKKIHTFQKSKNWRGERIRTCGWLLLLLLLGGGGGGPTLLMVVVVGGGGGGAGKFEEGGSSAGTLETKDFPNGVSQGNNTHQGLNVIQTGNTHSKCFAPTPPPQLGFGQSQFCDDILGRLVVAFWGTKGG